MFDVVTFWRRQSLAVRILVRLGAALSFVLWPWPALGRAFADAFASLANVFFRLGDSSMLNLRAEGPAASWNAILAVTGRDGTYNELLWDLRRVPFLPMAVFVALVAAIPFGRTSRRFGVLGAGLVVLQVLPALRMLLLIASETPIRLVEMPSALHSALLVACGAFVFPPSMAYVVPAALWLVAMWLADREALKSGVRELLGGRRELAIELSEARVVPAEHFGVVLRRPKKNPDRRRKRPRRSKKR